MYSSSAFFTTCPPPQIYSKMSSWCVLGEIWSKSSLDGKGKSDLYPLAPLIPRAVTLIDIIAACSVATVSYSLISFTTAWLVGAPLTRTLGLSSHIYTLSGCITIWIVLCNSHNSDRSLTLSPEVFQVIPPGAESTFGFHPRYKVKDGSKM